MSGILRITFEDESTRTISDVKTASQVNGFNGTGLGIATRTAGRPDSKWLATEAESYEVTEDVDLGFALQDNDSVSRVNADTLQVSDAEQVDP